MLDERPDARLRIVGAAKGVVSQSVGGVAFGALVASHLIHAIARSRVAR